MRFRIALFALALLAAHAFVNTAAAGPSPYVRFAFGGNQLRMTDVNSNIMNDERALKAAGLPADFRKVGGAYGPSAAAGLWVLPGFRLGATYSYQKAYRENVLHVPGSFFYDDQLTFRVREVGGEAVVRFARLAGLSFGGEVAQARAEFVEGYSVEDASGQLYLDASARRSKTTYGAFVGLDQANPSGGVGYIRAGFHYRDMGHMPAQGTVSDGVSTVAMTGNTTWMDYSGFYLVVGTGFDFGR